MADILIVNSEFCPPYELQDGRPELKVAAGWRAWWVHGGDPRGGPDRGYLVRPEFYSKEVGEANLAQGIQSTFSTHQGGVYQVVDVPAGVRDLRVVVRVRYLSRHTDGTGGGLGTRVGIDPIAGTEYDEERIVWGDWIGQDTPGWDGSTWRTMSVAVDRVPGPQVTVWLESRNREKARDNHTWWDSVQASVAGDDPGDPIGDQIVALLEGLLASARQIEADVKVLCARVEA